MGFHRATFVVGLAVGFIIGSRAGRERYDQIVKYTRKAAESPQAQRAGQAISAKATDLSKAAGAKAASLSKSAASRAPKVAGDAARKARERVKAVSVPKVSVPRVSVPRPGWRSGAHESAGQDGGQASVNGHGRHATTDGPA
jgi:cell division septum initiation protein DivIVA